MVVGCMPGYNDRDVTNFIKEPAPLGPKPLQPPVAFACTVVTGWEADKSRQPGLRVTLDLHLRILELNRFRHRHLGVAELAVGTGSGCSATSARNQRGATSPVGPFRYVLWVSVGLLG